LHFFVSFAKNTVFFACCLVGHGQILLYLVDELFEHTPFNFSAIITPLLVAIFLLLFLDFLTPEAALLVPFGFSGVVLLADLRDARIRAVKHFDILNKKVALLAFLDDGARVECIGVDGGSQQGVDMHRMCQFIIDLRVGYTVFLAPVQRLQQEFEPALFEFAFVFFEFAEVRRTVTELG
jgi:hypothetical protein